MAAITRAALMPQTGFEVSLDCFLWDLLDEGIADALDRIKGETGATGLIVPVHGPAVTQFRARPGVSPRTYAHPGGALFQPDTSRYAATRLRPVVAPWLRKSNPFKSVVQAARERGLGIGCAVAACYCPPVTERYQHAAIRDVFGDAEPWLCPANPDVQEYVRCMLADLSENYAVDSVRLSYLGFPWSSGSALLTRPDEHRGFVLGPVEVWLRSICFCESCKQLAKRDGVDVDRVVRMVADTLDEACRTGLSAQGSIHEFVEQYEDLAGYLHWRSGQLHRWLGSLKSACRCRLIVEEHQDRLRSALSLHQLQDAYDAIACACPTTNAAAVEEVLSRAKEWDRSRVCMLISAGPVCADPNSLVQAVHQAAQLGCHSVSIGDYGSVPAERLDWIRQAVRFARRESL